MNRLTDKTLLWIGPLILWVLASVFFNLATFFDATVDLRRFIPYGLLTIYLTWFVARWVVLDGQRRYPGLDQVSRRITWLAAGTVPALTFVMLVRVVLTRYWLFAEHPERAAVDWLYTVGINLFYFFLIFSIYESRYFFRQWLREKSQAEALRRANLEIQLQSLKAQVQPHFLFNSLNTLQALVVAEENRKAVRFIGDLAQVYRYLLQANDTLLISLEKELEFTHAYVNLLKTRFDEGLHVEVRVSPAYRTYQLPPLTLQLLIENAVKHNVASAARPLRVEISSNGSPTLLVRNNLQRKARGGVPSDQKGLANIASKYGLLGQAEVLIHETEAAFEVQVPLLNPDAKG